MDYKNIANARRMRVYRSTDPDLPFDKWKLVADTSIAAMKFTDDLSKEPHVRHYYRATYVFADGYEGTPSKMQSALPVGTVEEAEMKQNADLN